MTGKPLCICRKTLVFAHICKTGKPPGRSPTQSARSRCRLYEIPTEKGQYTFDKTKATVPSPGEGQHPSSDPRIDRTKWEVKPGVNIRDVFYKKRFRRGLLATVLEAADTGRRNAAGEKLYRCQGGWGPTHIPFPTIDQLEIDHTEGKHPVRCTWSVSYRRCTADGRCTI
jgi:hypothetical protein